MSGSNDGLLSKLPKLKFPTDYIQWRRRLLAFLQRDDDFLTGLNPTPEGFTLNTNNRNLRSWYEKSVKAKSTITLCLGDSAMALVRRFIDDTEKCAKDLWDEVERVYTSSNTQAIQNIRHRLDTLVFSDNDDWNKHVSKFLEIVGELATFDEELSEKDKVSKLIRSLPTSFAPLAMMSNLTEVGFDSIVNAVEAEVARRKNPNNPQTPNPSSTTSAPTQPKANVASKNRPRRRNRSRKSSATKDRNDDNCYYCGRRGHYARDCYKRKRDESGNNGTNRRNNSGQSRERHSSGGPSRDPSRSRNGSNNNNHNGQRN